VHALARFRRRWCGFGSDVRDLVVRGGLVITTPVGQVDGLVAMTVVQIDGDVVMRLQEDIDPDVLTAHLKAVRARVAGVHDLLRDCVVRVPALVGVFCFLAVVANDGIEDLLFRNLLAIATGAVLGLIARLIGQWLIPVVGGALFRKFLQEGI